MEPANATRRRVLSQVETDNALISTWLTPITPRKFVWTMAVPLRVSFDPPAEVYTGETVMSVTSGRLNSELKVLVASV